MKTENSILKNLALESLKNNWGVAIGTYFVFGLIITAISFIPILGFIGSILLTGPLTLGLTMFSLSVSRNQDISFDKLFKGFDNFGTAFLAYLLQVVFVILWSLLLIVPGIIAAISYSMTFFIIADNPGIGANEAIDKSKAMMQGYKMKYFLLALGFIGWGILCILTLGIGFLWLIPYMNISYAKFYEDLKGELSESSATNETLDSNVTF
jgi:uncharacterized membrane protein